MRYTQYFLFIKYLITKRKVTLCEFSNKTSVNLASEIPANRRLGQDELDGRSTSTHRLQSWQYGSHENGDCSLGHQ